MHIGVDATVWTNQRGYGRHARGLLSSLVQVDTDNLYTFFVDGSETLPTLPSGVQVRHVQTIMPATRAASASGHRTLRDTWRMSSAMADPSLDLLLFPTVYSYVPVFSRAKKVVMIHDIIAEKYPQLTLPRRTLRFFWTTKVALCRWQADAIATVSEFSRQAIIRHFGTRPEQVFVVGEASDPIFRKVENPAPTQHLASLGIGADRRYIVYVGGFNPHKNLEALINAFAELTKNDDFPRVQLVMVGEYEKEVFHSYFAVVRQLVLDLGLADRVTFTGYLPDDQLVVLLNLATVLVLPSLMEGFGLPAVEAAACGCPVIATKFSPLPDLLLGGGLYFDPTDHQELIAALFNVLKSEELRQRMGEEALKAASRLTWESAAKQLIALEKQVAAK